MASYYSSSSSLAVRDFSSAKTHLVTSRLFPERSSNRFHFLFLHPSSRSSRSVVVFSRRRKTSPAVAQTNLSKSNRSRGKEETAADGEDALEALFSQLEEDLKNDVTFSDDDEDEIGEDELASLEQELEEAFGIGDDDSDEILDVQDSELDGTNRSDVEDDEEARPKLKNWQLRRLARALKIGRRKTSIKNLSAEMGLDRAYVLELLREPPLDLLMLSSSLSEEVTETYEPVSEPVDPPAISEVRVSENEPKAKDPVHVMQRSWIMQKRLKKVQLITLEKVYARTKHPSNAMISSIVHVTNLPWKKVVKWFEDKRLEDGVPKHREPFRRVVHENISV